MRPAKRLDLACDRRRGRRLSANFGDAAVKRGLEKHRGKPHTASDVDSTSSPP
jgi:hypothetical protein